MECDDFTDTGGDVYARGHLRAIAAVVGIDPGGLIAAYDEAPSVRRPPAP
jgi:cytoskeleton protein RodZ